MKFTVEAADLSKAETMQQFADWALKTKDNLLDARVLFYPTTNVIVVKDENGDPILFMPFQATVTLESLAVRPGIDPRQEALALRELFNGIKNVCQFTGVREVWFNCKDEQMIEFLKGRGFEPLQSTVLRKRVEGPEIPPISVTGKQCE
jgi:hypothetical protein